MSCNCGSARLIVILDRSGSMSSVQEDMKGGFDRLIEEQKGVPGTCLVTLVQFDTEIETVYRDVPIRDVPKLKLEPRGMTALYQAIGQTLDTVGHHDRSQSCCEGKTIVVIITDGQDNQPGRYSRSMIGQMVAHRQSAHGWTFLFLGANIDAFDEARQLHIPSINTLTYQQNARGMRAMYSSVSASIGSTRTGGGSALLTPDVDLGTP